MAQLVTTAACPSKINSALSTTHSSKCKSIVRQQHYHRLLKTLQCPHVRVRCESNRLKRWAKLVIRQTRPYRPQCNRSLLIRHSSTRLRQDSPHSRRIRSRQGAWRTRGRDEWKTQPPLHPLSTLSRRLLLLANANPTRNSIAVWRATKESSLSRALTKCRVSTTWRMVQELALPWLDLNITIKLWRPRWPSASLRRIMTSQLRWNERWQWQWLIRTR